MSKVACLGCKSVCMDTYARPGQKYAKKCKKCGMTNLENQRLARAPRKKKVSILPPPSQPKEQSVEAADEAKGKRMGRQWLRLFLKEAEVTLTDPKSVAAFEKWKTDYFAARKAHHIKGPEGVTARIGQKKNWRSNAV